MSTLQRRIEALNLLPEDEPKNYMRHGAWWKTTRDDPSIEQDFIDARIAVERQRVEQHT